MVTSQSTCPIGIEGWVDLYDEWSDDVCRWSWCVCIPHPQFDTGNWCRKQCTASLLDCSTSSIDYSILSVVQSWNGFCPWQVASEGRLGIGAYVRFLATFEPVAVCLVFEALFPLLRSICCRKTAVLGLPVMHITFLSLANLHLLKYSFSLGNKLPGAVCITLSSWLLLPN